jgi:zinc-ribbon domain
MYCPNCATQNVDGSKFCRSCGANIALVPMALSGQLENDLVASESLEESKAGGACGGNRKRSAEDGIKSIFIGIGFLFVALALALNHANWWFWLLIPAFATFGGGVAEFLKSRRLLRQAPVWAGTTATSMKSPRHSTPVLPRATNELTQQPPSITEGTTRHLGAEKVHSPYDEVPR